MKDYSLSFFSGSSKEIDHGSKMNVGQENSAIMDHHYQHPPQQFPQYYQGKLIFSRGHQRRKLLFMPTLLLSQLSNDQKRVLPTWQKIEFNTSIGNFDLGFFKEKC